MANSYLVGRRVVFPKALLPRIREACKGRPSQQLKNLYERGYLEYDDLKNIKKNYPLLSDAEKLAHGGDTFYAWVVRQLNSLRDRVEQKKKNSTMAGLSNQYIKPHEKTHNVQTPNVVKITENTFKKLKENGFLH